MSTRISTRIAIATLAAAGVAVAIGGPASAHVGIDKEEIVAGERTTLSFSFSHGCAESPTNSMKFQVPEGIVNAVPQVHPGWDIAVERAPLATPIESAHGDPVTDRPAVITFTASDGWEVPGGQRDEFTLAFTAPETTGDLFFPVIQGCVEGSNDWIAQWDGTGTEPDQPAPSVKVVAAGDEGTETESGTESSAPTTTVAVDEPDDDDSSSNTLGIIGIVVGAAGLGTGGAALAASRKQRANS